MTQAATLSSSLKLKVRAHEGQRKMLASEAFCTAAIAGTGGGKTSSGFVWSAIQLVTNPGMVGLIAEPTDDMVTKVLLTPRPGLPDYVSFMRKFDPDLVYNKGEGSIRSKLGTVYLASAFNPDTWQGGQLGWIWLDEAGLMKRLAFTTAMQRAGYYDGKLLITTTPYNMGWLKSDVYDSWMSGDEDYTVVNYPTLANPTYPRDVIERARRTLSPERFAMMYEGKFGRPEGMIYQSFDEAKHVVDDFEIPARWERIGGFDFGFNHPAAGLMIAKDDDGRYFAYREYYEREKTARHAGRVLAGRGGEGFIWFCDSARPDNIRELRDLGLSAVPANKEVLDGIDTVYELFASDRLFVFRSLANLRDELGSYVWKQDPKTDEWMDEPVKENDDLCDALRYALHSTLSRTGLTVHF